MASVWVLVQREREGTDNIIRAYEREDDAVEALEIIKATSYGCTNVEAVEVKFIKGPY